MGIAKGLRENLRFLLAEVGGQISNLHAYFETASPVLADRILDRAGYAYNLKMRIHDGCLSRLACGKRSDWERIILRSLESVATDLERITERCRDCIRQMIVLDNRRYLDAELFGELLDHVDNGLRLVEPAVVGRDTALALELGEVQRLMERGYRRLHKRYIRELKRRKHTEALIASLFVAHAVARMGDSLRHIGEAVISANLGQQLNLERYRSLQSSLSRFALEAGGPLQIEPIAETRSGSAISGVATGDEADEGYVAIFKEGEKRKLKEERQGVESWHEIYPGLAPQIFAYNKQGRSATMLIEHLAGLTFEQILLHESPLLLDEALAQLSNTLKSVWKQTRSKRRVPSRFMRQTRKRMKDVYGVHPEFQWGESRICDCTEPSFDTLLQQAEQYEEGLKSPFAVYIHGDFNVDNIIYDPVDKRINFIDLHRSCYMDYVQDVSVFMVSNYRLQILDTEVRRRIMSLAQEFYRFARRHARKVGDDSFELRLALGLARSFATSTRFILDKTLARRMFLRARYLLEQVLSLDEPQVAKYRVPIAEIFIE